MLPTPGRSESLIARLLDLSPAERAAVLREVSVHDPGAWSGLVPVSDALVAVPPVVAPLSEFRPDAVVRALEAALELPPGETAGTRIGSYKLLEEVGEGGFGVVWMAEQEEPMRRRVALKIIKSGMDTKEVIARFEAERQALALMDHSNIARVFDAGATSTGRPYFVMELVRGVAITRYCDDNRLSADARLRLFIAVCQAVQHAHQKGVIHRDLKPSNVLVTLHDGVPVPKIIDFGIAKATHGGRLTDKTLFTQLHAFIGTPAYTSPEQMEMSGLDVDTRSDIYSLGVLLYELLTGRPPFDPDTLAKSGLEAMRRMIRELDPPRPSHRLSTLSREDRMTVAQQRGTDGAKLSFLLRGDLDWIVMHCLEKDRARRYETAAGLAQDIQCHLANEPVSARPPSGAYRLRKFIRRNRGVFVAGTAIAIALVTGLIVSSVLFLRERAARERAVAAERRARVAAAKSTQVAQFMRDMLAGVGPAVARGRDTAMLREILDQTAQRLEIDLKDDPQVAADLQDALGALYRDLGQYGTAEGLVRRAVLTRRADDGKASAALAASLDSLGVILTRLNKPEEAEAVLQEALAMRRTLLGNEHAAVADTLHHISFVPIPGRTTEEIATMRREVLAMRRKLFGPEHVAVAESLHGLALAAWNNLQLGESIALHREALTMRRTLLGDEHPAVTESLSDLGYSLEHSGRIAAAEEVYREAFFVQRKILGDGHPRVVATLLAFAGKSMPENRLGETIGILREFIANQRKILGADSGASGVPLLALAPLLDRQQPGSLEARALVAEGRALLEKTRLKGPSLEPTTIVAMSFFAWSHYESGTPADGLVMGEESFRLAQAALGVVPAAVLPTRVVAWIYFSLGRMDAAATQFEAAVRLEKTVLGPAHPFTLMDSAGLGAAWRETGRLSEARRVLDDGLAVANGHADDRLAYSIGGMFLCELGLILNGERRFAEAEGFFRESFVRYDARSVELLLHRIRPKALAAIGLARSLAGQGRFAEAEPVVTAAYEELKSRRDALAGDRDAFLREAIAAVVEIYAGAGKLDQVQAWREKLTALPSTPTDRP